MNRPKLDARFWLVLLLITFATFLLHEGGHWFAGELQGADMEFGLNNVRRVGGATLDAHAAMIVIASGPLVTIVQALIALLVVLRTGSLTAYAVLFSATYMRWMGAVISLFNPNDEARLSSLHGWGQWTLPVLVVAGLVALTWAGSRRLGLGWRTNGLIYLGATVFGSLMVGLDMLLP